jgi:putative CRISPR-associated protein (TIGR02619 family)
MGTTHIVTCGTSLKSNAKGCNTPDELFRYVSENPERASAECNALLRLAEGGDEIILVHSATEDGKLCAEVLDRFLQNREFQVKQVELKSWGTGVKELKQKGLRDLVSVVIDEMKPARAKGNEVKINVTGGMKSVVSYATALGLVFHLPVYLMHESYDEVLTIPPLPIEWDFAKLVEAKDLIEYVEQDLRSYDDYLNRKRAYRPEVQSVLESLYMDEEGLAYATPLGFVVLQAFREIASDERNYWFTKDAWATFKKSRSPLRDRYNDLIRAVRRPECAIQAEKKRNAPDILFYPKGPCQEHVAFYELGDGIVVAGLYPTHADYEKAIDSRQLSRSACQPTEGPLD